MSTKQAFLLSVLIGATAWGEEPSLQASLSAEDVALGDTVQLTLTLTRDASQAYQGYLRPDWKDFDVLQQSQGESTQWTIVNGRQSVRTTEQHVYMLRPRHKGKCVIPPAVARLGGREVKTRELIVWVHPQSKRPAVMPAPTQGVPEVAEPESVPARGSDEVFVDAHAEKLTVFVGEPITVSWTLFTRNDLLRYAITAEPKHEDFWSEEMVPPGQTLGWTRKSVRGQEYLAALLLKRALSPLKAGRLVISPLQVEATTLETAFFVGGSAIRASKPLVVEVLPLPATGRPADFSPTNVGRFELAAKVDRTDVKAGDAVTLRLIARGQGNLKNLRLKKLDRIEGFKVYEPTVTEHREGGGLRGEKTYSYLLLPQRGGALTIPAQEMAYFDPDEKHYILARSQPITLRVTGDPGQLGAATAGSAKENLLGARLRPLRNVHRLGSHVGDRLWRGKLFWTGLMLPPGIFLLLIAGGTLRATLVRETARSKRRRARAIGRRRLREAETHLRGMKRAAFYGACTRAIYEHLENQLGSKCEALTVDELRRLLIGRGADGDTAEAVVHELEACDFARFAPSASGPGEMRAAIRRVRALLGRIERARIGAEEAAS